MMSVQFTLRIPKCPNTKKWLGVKDTREDMHSIMNTGKRLIVNVRLITCLCPGCLHGDSDSSMCSYSGNFPKVAYALRNCSDCGVQKLKLHLNTVNTAKLLDDRECFLIKNWKNKKEKVPGTDTMRTYMHWSHDTLCTKGLIDQYVNLLDDMSSHTFFAAWNFHQYLVCKKNIEKGQVLMVHDYAQNYFVHTSTQSADIALEPCSSNNQSFLYILQMSYFWM